MDIVMVVQSKENVLKRALRNYFFYIYTPWIVRMVLFALLFAFIAWRNIVGVYLGLAIGWFLVPIVTYYSFRKSTLMLFREKNFFCNPVNCISLTPFGN